MLTILLGDYGSGKTATAQYLAKQNGGVHLRSELLTRGNVPMLDKLKAIMKPGINYYLDGWNGNYHFEDLPGLLGERVRYIVCMAAPMRVFKTQQKRGVVGEVLPRTGEAIRITTQHAINIALTYDDAPLFADTTTRPVTFWGKDKWLSRWMEINLYDQFKGKNEYQDVELSDRYITGLSQSYKTWERLDSTVDFKGKSVVDYGCNYGYFCFKAERAGAASVTGVDVSGSIIAKAQAIAMVRNSKVHLVIANLKKYEPPYSDIAMALNTLHHLDYDSKVLDWIFSRANKVILEMPAKDRQTVDKVAHSYLFTSTVVGSHREGRCIVVYAREKKIVIPRKYRYHPRYERVKWWAIRTAAHCYPLRVMLHLWRKLR